MATVVPVGTAGSGPPYYIAYFPICLYCLYYCLCNNAQQWYQKGLATLASGAIEFKTFNEK